MKKYLAVLMLAAMLLSAGCGTTDGAKKDAQDAANKVEQKVDEAKDKVDEAAKDAVDKVDEAKKDAADKVDEAKKDAADKIDEAKDKVDEVINGRTVALGGLMPGSTSLDDVQAMFGEATSTDGNVLTFVNGLKVTLDDAKKVKEISTTSADFDTPEGVYVGASEYSAIRQIPNGAEYEYFSGDKKSKTVYKAQNGIITEITCSLK